MSRATMVAEFVRALALGWKNLAAYPPGHPVLVSALGQLQRRLDEIRGPAGDVVFGIAADGLIVFGEKVETEQAQKLAQALYTRGVALLTFASGTAPADIETFLRLLAARTQETKRPMWDELTAAGVKNVVLQPVDYSGVRVTDSLAEPESKSEPASLWDDILRALIAGKHLAGTDTPLPKVRSVDELSALLSRYIDGAGDEAPFDPNATFGVAKVRVPEPSDAIVRRIADAIGGHIANSRGLKRDFAVGQVTQLLKTLPEVLRAAVIRSVLRVLATDEGAGVLLREFVTPLARDEVLEGLRALASTTRLSTHATLLLRTLLDVAPPPTRTEAPVEVLGELLDLFGEEDIDRFNPPDHRALLEDVSIDLPRMPPDLDPEPGRLGNRVATVSDDLVIRSLAQTALDLLASQGSSQPPAAVLARVEKAFGTLLDGAQFGDAIDVVHRMREIGASADSETLRDAIRDSLARLASPERIENLVTGLQSAPPHTTALMQKLIEAMGIAAAQNLLVALAEENNRSRRRRLFDFICSLGHSIVPVATSFLGDSRWYVVRNMIVLLRSVGDRTSLPHIRRCAQHPDLRVRLEAIKTLLALEAVPTALLDEAINDPDPKLAETAITLVASYGIREGVGPLLKILDGNDVFGKRRMIRLKAIKALGELGDPAALPRMQRFFPDPFLPWPTRDERLAVYASLGEYPEDARKPFVTVGLRSRDAQIRSICERLAPEDDEEGDVEWSD